MSRVIRKSQTRSSAEAASLLANLFAAELVSPSECIWLVSPWISDIQILDNEVGAFDPLSRWGPRSVRLAEVLATLASCGSSVVIGTTADPHNDEFIAHLSRPRCRTRRQEQGAHCPRSGQSAARKGHYRG